MRGFLCRIFGVYREEANQAIRFARLALFWAFGSACLETLSDALFLEQVGADQLPRVYASIAVGMIVLSSIVLWRLRASSPYKMLMTALLFASFFSIGSSLVFSYFPSDVFWYLLKIGSKIFFSVLIAISWTFADQYHDLQEAKRLYSLYSAAYFMGTVFAGLAINFLLDRIGFPGLFILSSIAFFFALLETKRIAIQTKALADDTVEGVFTGSRDSFGKVVQLIFRSPFALVLLSLSLFTQLLITVTEFNYMETFGHQLQNGGEGAIAEFLGKWRAGISFFNIIIGLFFYGRMVRKTGLPNAILITPLFFSGVYSGWVSSDSLLFAILGLVAVDGILFTIEDNCFNLLSNGVPSRLKSRVRIINDSFFEPIGMLLSALLLMSFEAGSKWLGAGLTAIMLLLTLFLRSIYGKALLANLRENSLHFERNLRAWFRSFGEKDAQESRQAMLQALVQGGEDRRLLASKALLQLQDISLLTPILQASLELGTLSKITLLRELEASTFANEPAVADAVREWLEEAESPELSKRVSLFLAKKGCHLAPERELTHPDLWVRAAALLTHRDHPETSRILEAMLASERIDEIAMALEIRTELDEKSTPPVSFLSHDSLLVQRAAAKWFARKANPSFALIAPKLLQELVTTKDNACRLLLIEALEKVEDREQIQPLLIASCRLRPNERRRAEEAIFQMGTPIIQELLALTKDPSMPDRARILAGKILTRLSPSALQSHLAEILDLEIKRACFYFYFGHTIPQKISNSSLLENALLTGFQSVIDFIVHLLGAAGSLEDPELIVRSLKSKNEKVQSQAIESLEGSCDETIYSKIAPLLDDLPIQEKLEACVRSEKSLPSLGISELFDALEHSPALFDQLISLRLKTTLQENIAYETAQSY